MPDVLEDLGDVDERDALLAGGEGGRHPVDDHVGTAAGDHLRRGNVGAARLDVDVEPGLLVEALVLGDVVAAELGLGDPFKLQRQLVGGLGTACPQERRQPGDGGHNSHLLPPWLQPGP